MNPYLEDILSQPRFLRRTVESFPAAALSDIQSSIRNDDIDRVILTGMGASHNAAYPAVLAMTDLPVPVQLWNSAELVHYLGDMITGRTLLWMNSQSGRSAELVHLLEKTGSSRPAVVLACVNDLDSPLARASDVCLSMLAGPESTVGTKTYMNTLAVNLLAASVLAGKDHEALRSELLAAADTMETYLETMEDRVSSLDQALGDFENLILLGRGASMSSVWNGALINKEAAKHSLEGMNAAEFRHGPLELVEKGFSALILAGSKATSGLNRKMALEIRRLGGRAFWIDSEEDAELETILIPDTPETVQPLMEILPLQLLTIVLARRKSLEPGLFRHVTKITTVE